MTVSARLLRAVVLLAGVGTLGVEMVASRLLAPYFGTSQPIWAVVIGMTLLYLALGYQLGGRLADRSPDPQTLARLLGWAGLLTGLIPLLAAPILRLAQQSLGALAVGGFVGALLGVLLLFAAPVTLMAMVTPFALRLVATDPATLGRTAGGLSALSTVGSILGTFLTALVLIPTIGTASSTYLFALLLLLLGLALGRSWRWLPALALLLALAGWHAFAPGVVKAADCRDCTLLYETESASNYIQVAARDSARGQTVNLVLNEGQAIHSIYNTRYAQTNNPIDLLTSGGPWDYFAVAPFFVPGREPGQIQSAAIIGSATGTTPKQLLAIYGPQLTVDAVEIDPAIIDVGRRFFALDDASVSPLHPNYHAVSADGRQWLATLPASRRYDIIGLDAYRQPYIPFHLTTVEFFQSVRDHLTDAGVVVVNAGVGPGGDDRLGQQLAATMRSVFPQVFAIETAAGGNQILVAVRAPVGDGVSHFANAYARIQDPALHLVLGWALTRGEGPVRELFPDPKLTPYTDDRAPVERLVDQLIVDTVAR